jgi:hypothetical protein
VVTHPEARLLGVKLRRYFLRFDFDHSLRWQEGAVRGLTLHAQGSVNTGFRAFRMLLLYNPFTYFVLALILAAPEPGGLPYRRWIAGILFLMFSPLFFPIGQAIYERIDRRA